MILKFKVLDEAAHMIFQLWLKPQVRYSHHIQNWQQFKCRWLSRFMIMNVRLLPFVLCMWLSLHFISVHINRFAWCWNNESFAFSLELSSLAPRFSSRLDWITPCFFFFQLQTLHAVYFDGIFTEQLLWFTSRDCIRNGSVIILWTNNDVFAGAI